MQISIPKYANSCKAFFNTALYWAWESIRREIIITPTIILRRFPNLFLFSCLTKTPSEIYPRTEAAMVRIMSGGSMHTADWYGPSNEISMSTTFPNRFLLAFVNKV